MIPVADQMAMRPIVLPLKKVGENNEALSGARFRLSFVSNAKPDSQLVIGEYDVDADGALMINELMAGATYKLEELSAPAGYSLLTKPVIFRVAGNSKGTISVVSGDAVIRDGELVVLNKKAVPEPITPVPFDLMPETGDRSSLLLSSMILFAALLVIAVLKRFRARRV